MRQVTNVIKSIYNFFVGDPVVLSGIVILFVVVGIFTHTVATTNNWWLGIILFAGVVLSLGLALYRETQPKKR